MSPASRPSVHCDDAIGARLRRATGGRHRQAGAWSGLFTGLALGWFSLPAADRISTSVEESAASPAAASTARYRPPLPGRLATDQGQLYAILDPAEPGVVQHPAGLFVLRFPGHWRVLVSARGDYVSYIVSPEAGRVPPSQLRTGVRVAEVVMSDVFRRQRWTPTAMLKHLLPAFLKDEPGMKLDGDPRPARLGGLEAAACTLRGPRKDVPGEHVKEIVVAEKDGIAFQLTALAPAEDSAGFQAAWEKIAADSRFGREGLPRRDTSLEARRIVQQYKGSVVSIVASGGGRTGTGSGFIISRDGHVLTNYHVAFDTRTGQPMEKFTVEWDESLRRPKVEAQLVSGKFRLSPYRFQHGTDVALLQIPAGAYEPLPLSPLADVEAGDSVVTLGFPSRGLIEGVSLTVTTGVVTRFNRGPQGEVASIYVDAAFTHGSSGGPCVSLVTGGVIGLNSFGMDVQLDTRSAALNDLIKYHGVVPIDAAIREFPLVCTPGLNPQGTGLDFLACLELSKHFLGCGSFAAAEKIALRAVSLEPQQAIARSRLGDCRFELALEHEHDGRSAEAKTAFAATRKAYEEALARDARLATALNACARLELHLGRLQEADTFAARATEADPEGWEGHLLRADIALRQSQPDAALRHVAQARRAVGGLLVNPHMTAAAIYVAKRDLEHARAEWQEAARISPVHLPARLGVASYFEAVRQTDAALAEYRRILDDFPENGEVLGRIGLCLNGAGRTAEALNYFQRSIQRCQAAAETPDPSVLMFLGDALLQRPDSVEAVPVFTLYLFHHRRGPWAALANLKLADIHAQHQARGLASAHARLAEQTANPGNDVLQAARRHAPAQLSLEEIKALAGVLQYPPSLAAEIVAASPLGFRLDETQVLALQREGIPEPILRAMLESLSRHPVAPAEERRGFEPPPPPSPGGPPPESIPPGFAPAPESGPDVRGTWVATGVTPDGQPFRSVIIFGDYQLYSSNTWFGQRSTGLQRGQYRFENGRLILQPENGPPHSPRFQVRGDNLIMDVMNFAPGVRFVRERQSSGFNR